MTDKELIRSALEALESCSGAPHWEALQPVVTALRRAEHTHLTQQLPDVLVYEGHETLQYIEGWNDCREFMKGMR